MDKRANINSQASRTSPAGAGGRYGQLIKKYMRLIISLVILISIFSCNHKSTTKNYCTIDSTEIDIYSTVIEKYILPELDSSLKFDSIKNVLIVVKNNRQNVLLLDSTKSISQEYLDRITDSSFAVGKLNVNNQQCKLTLGKIQSTTFYPFSRIDYLKYFDKDKGAYPGFSGLRQDYPDVAGILKLSNIGYNLQKDRAFVEINFSRGGLYGFGIIILLRKVEGVWVVESEILEWIS